MESARRPSRPFTACFYPERAREREGETQGERERERERERDRERERETWRGEENGEESTTDRGAADCGVMSREAHGRSRQQVSDSCSDCSSNTKLAQQHSGAEASQFGWALATENNFRDDILHQFSLRELKARWRHRQSCYRMVRPKGREEELSKEQDEDFVLGNTFQKRSVSSPAPVTMVWPSGEMARYSTR